MKMFEVIVVNGNVGRRASLHCMCETVCDCSRRVRYNVAVRLGRSFFQRETQIVARELLGKVLVYGGTKLIIAETEAYLGPEDLASHARFGPTPRKKIMWGNGGFLYIYLIYGMHEMMNIVTGEAGEPGAVLVRAGLSADTRQQVAGPGKVSQYLGITRRENGVDIVTSPTLRIDDKGILPDTTSVTPRIGIDYAGLWRDVPLRFVGRFE